MIQTATILQTAAARRDLAEPQDFARDFAQDFAGDRCAEPAGRRLRNIAILTHAELCQPSDWDFALAAIESVADDDDDRTATDGDDRSPFQRDQLSIPMMGVLCR